MPGETERTSEPRRSQDRHTGERHRDNTVGFQPVIPGDGRGIIRPIIPRVDGVIHAAGGPHSMSGAVPRRWSGAPGAGRSDGGAIGPDRGTRSADGPDFALNVARNGYAWWYIDALSDDGRYGLTIIAFIGSVFSPYYALARSRGNADPENHVAVNVALYGKGVRRWTMTERSRSALDRSEDTLSIDSSALHWDGNALVISIDEIAVPFPRRVKGRVRLLPGCLPGLRYEIDGHGRHRWQPIAPIARVEAQLSHPSLEWSGDAYFDHNHGDEPLESGFVRWDWSRQSLKTRARLLYDLSPRAGPAESLAIEISGSGAVSHFEGPPRVSLPRSNWRVARGTRCDGGHRASIRSSLEDAPFYARSVIETSINGDTTPSLHESLDLDRFRAPVVQAMLPFRMPRRSF